jgi:hypothetical protein
MPLLRAPPAPVYGPFRPRGRLSWTAVKAARIVLLLIAAGLAALAIAAAVAGG